MRDDVRKVVVVHLWLVVVGLIGVGVVLARPEFGACPRLIQDDILIKLLRIVCHETASPLGFEPPGPQNLLRVKRAVVQYGLGQAHSWAKREAGPNTRQRLAIERHGVSSDCVAVAPVRDYLVCGRRKIAPVEEEETLFPPEARVPFPHVGHVALGNANVDDAAHRLLRGRLGQQREGTLDERAVGNPAVFPS